MRRQFERNFLSMEYIKSLIWTKMDKIGHQDIREYYEQHRNEFQTVDGVKWQDLFIALGPQHPTLASARLFGEHLAARLRRGSAINQVRPDVGRHHPQRQPDRHRTRQARGQAPRPARL